MILHVRFVRTATSNLTTYLSDGSAVSRGARARSGTKELGMDSIEYLGLVASTMATFAFLPQVVKTWRTGSATISAWPRC